MIMRIAYLLTSGSLLALLIFEAPRGALLTSTPEKGKVDKQGPTKKGGRSVRAVPVFVFVGGGYRGGK